MVGRWEKYYSKMEKKLRGDMHANAGKRKLKQAEDGYRV